MAYREKERQKKGMNPRATPEGAITIHSQSFAYLFTHLITRSFILSLIHSFAHSLIRAYIQEFGRLPRSLSAFFSEGPFIHSLNPY